MTYALISCYNFRYIEYIDLLHIYDCSFNDYFFDVVQASKICLNCGDKGFPNALIHCVNCLEFVVHW